MTPSDDFRASRLRPYAVTGGRTRGGVDLAIETMVRTTPAGERAGARLGFERQEIISLCREPLSVAEVSAHLGLHLHAVRVLLGDLAAEGYVVPTSAPAAADSRPDLRLLERVLDGLNSL